MTYAAYLYLLLRSCNWTPAEAREWRQALAGGVRQAEEPGDGG